MAGPDAYNKVLYRGYLVLDYLFILDFKHIINIKVLYVRNSLQNTHYSEFIITKGVSSQLYIFCGKLWHVQNVLKCLYMSQMTRLST